MAEQKIIKVILPGMCPHCSQEIRISCQMMSPFVDWVLKPENLDQAKASVRSVVEKADMPAADKEAVLKWLDHPDTLMGPEEAPRVIEQILQRSVDEKPDVDADEATP